MAVPRKHVLAFAHFPYGGNGGISSEVPYVRHWKERIIPWMIADPRIHSWHSKDFSDTPIPMTRNAAVLWAREMRADFLIMVDSDMWPDRYLGRDAKPFLESSFDYAYRLWDDKPLCIFSPYCGMPPEEPPFVFEWRTFQSDNKDDLLKLEMMTREHASALGGFHEVAAGPTGLMMTDMRLFDLCDPVKVKETLGVDKLEHRGWFYYEFTNDYGSEKASTEDVTFTRELSQVGISKLNYNPLVCNFDAWSAHMKPKAVGKPLILKADQVNERLVAAVKAAQKSDYKVVNIDYTKGLKLPEADIVEMTVEEIEAGAGQAFSDEDVPVKAGYNEAVPGVGAVAGNKRNKIELIREEREFFGRKVTSLGFTTGPFDVAALAAAFRERVASHTRRSLRTLMAVEIGSWVGETAIAMHQAAADVPRANFEIHCVDPHRPYNDGNVHDLYGAVKDDEVSATFRENVRGLERIKYHRVPSVTAASKWNTHHKVEFLFIDGDHSYEGVLIDLKAWSPHLSRRAVIVFHDYMSKGFPGVTQAIKLLCHNDEGLVYHPPGTNIAIVRMEELQRKRRFMKSSKGGGCGPAGGGKAMSPPKGGPAQKTSSVKGGPAKGKKK